MKKKVLIVIGQLILGGAEKALVNFLNEIDYNKYEVDLQLCYRYGDNEKYIPAEVNIIPPFAVDNEYFMRFKPLVIKQMKKGHLLVVLRRLYYALLTFVFARNNGYGTKYYAWKFQRKYLPKTKHYDVAIGFFDGVPNYYVVDIADADQKICWCHSNCSKREVFAREYSILKKADLLATVSEQCMIEFKKYQPKLRNIKVVYNINSIKLINKLSDENIDDCEMFDGDEYKILSIGRLCEIKGFDMAIDAAKILKDTGVQFKWYIMGSGPLRDNLNKQIKSLGLEDFVYMIGTRGNPYPYIKKCDIIVQSSVTEGKSVVLDEAKILAKPIVCTKYDSAYDQIDDEKSGILVPISCDGIAFGIQKLICDQELRQNIINNLANSNFEQNEYIEAYDKILSGNVCDI